MKAFAPASWLPLGFALLSGAQAQSWSTIPPIQASGQHFFYSNNGSQFYMKGVAYQQNYNGNGSTGDAGVTYTDPLADIDSCTRDIPYMKQIFTNIIRVYAVDPTQNHDACMELLAANDIYVVADLSEPDTSINSDDPSWNVALYQRYAAVIDSLAKYNNVVGFFAGNEVVEKANQTASAAFVKAAVRDSKAYITSQNHRSSLGVGYATADVPTRDQLAAYFACEPTSDKTGIDFWGYNVYSWCGDSNYVSSSYGERVDFFSKYPVPVFFAEYGCNQGLSDPHARPFTEVAVLYGNMTEVFSGGIVYQWFESDNHYGLVSLSGNSISLYPDFTSLKSQLATVSPTITQSSNYKPSNAAPACPTNDNSWLPQASPLPPPVNPQLCDCEVAGLGCAVNSDDSDSYADNFNYICGLNNGKYCMGIARNASTGDYGAIGGCSPKQQLAFVANQYYMDHGKSASACDFGGVAAVQTASTATSCSGLISAAGTDGTGSVPSPTGSQGGTAGTSGAASSSNLGAPGVVAPGYYAVGKALLAAYVVAAIASGVGMIVL